MAHDKPPVTIDRIMEVTDQFIEEKKQKGEPVIPGFRNVVKGVLVLEASGIPVLGLLKRLTSRR